MDIMAMYSDLIQGLTEYCELDQLIYQRNQLESEIQLIGREKRLMQKYTMVLSAIDQVTRKLSTKTFNRKDSELSSYKEVIG